ncbi:MAG: HAD family hydrolase [Pseudodesulfovibrio sp.]|nr:HAD family hydrolase [Pseudodesulfovibrio sp.]
MAVGFDLDGTLYDHGEFVGGAYKKVAAWVSKHCGVPEEGFFQTIFSDWRERSSRCSTIFADALHLYGVYSESNERSCVLGYRSYEPEMLTPFCGVENCFDDLKEKGVKIGLLTDGQSDVQRNKIRALGLGHHFDHIVITGDLGRSFYKPHEAGFKAIAKGLEVSLPNLIYVGDRPDVDIQPSRNLGYTPLRILHGEYASEQSEVACFEFSSFEMLSRHLIDTFLVKCV